MEGLTANLGSSLDVVTTCLETDTGWAGAVGVTVQETLGAFNCTDRCKRSYITSLSFKIRLHARLGFGLELICFRDILGQAM